MPRLTLLQQLLDATQEGNLEKIKELTEKLAKQKQKEKTAKPKQPKQPKISSETTPSGVAKIPNLWVDDKREAIADRAFDKKVQKVKKEEGIFKTTRAKPRKITVTCFKCNQTKEVLENQVRLVRSEKGDTFYTCGRCLGES